MPTDICGACPFELGTTLSKIKPFCSYWVFGNEFGEPTPEKPEGYHHWQFFFQLSKNRPWTWINTKLPGVHVEMRKKSVEEAMSYCMKDGEFEQGGQVVDRPGQGARSDLEVFVEDSKTLDNKQLWSKHPSQMARYYHVPERVRADFVTPRSKVTRFNWIFGEPGCGKTLYVTQKHPDIYIKNDKSVWWDGYHGQKQVLLDEVNNSDFPYNALLQLGNGGALKVQVKGGHVEFVAEVLYLVSNTQPQLAYHKDFLENAHALLRRTTFYRARKGEPHELLLQQVRFDHGNWIDVGNEVSRHVDYPDDIEVDEI